MSPGNNRSSWKSLYVGGYLNIADGNHGNYIQKWDGSTWSDVGGGVLGLGGSQGQITDLFLHDTKLYAIGNFETTGGIPAQYVASWDGTNWCGFGTSFDNRVLQGYFYRDTLCVGGGFHTVDGDSIDYIAKWVGGTFIDTCGHIDVGITETTNDNTELNIYPNPVLSSLTIELGEAEKENRVIEIRNVLGQTIKTLQLISGTKHIEVCVSDLSNGLYFVQIQNEHKSVSKKFIKQ